MFRSLQLDPLSLTSFFSHSCERLPAQPLSFDTHTNAPGSDIPSLPHWLQRLQLFRKHALDASFVFNSLRTLLSLFCRIVQVNLFSFNYLRTLCRNTRGVPFDPEYVEGHSSQFGKLTSKVKTMTHPSFSRFSFIATRLSRANARGHSPLVYTERIFRGATFLLLCIVAFSAPTVFAQQPQSQDEARGAPAEPTDAADTRAQIATLEKLLPSFPDRGAILYNLAALHQHLGESLEALKLLKDCVALGEGFDPSGGPEYAPLHSSHEFTDLVEKVHRDFLAVAHARLALVTEEKNLIPEGLAWDFNRKVFYLSSLAQKKIVQITPDSHTSDFVPANRDHLLPVLGIRLDPRDNSIWTNTMEDSLGKAELVHFDPSGNLLGRFSLDDNAKHGFNDLVVRKSGEILLTDSLNNLVFRFDPEKKSFAPLNLHRELLYPNGIALFSDDKTLFVADAIGVIRIDLTTLKSLDINPGQRSTLAGADGLYWYNGSLIAVQNGIGSPRIAAFKLSDDGTRVTKTTVLENRSSFTGLPTTGAIRGSDFYFISNSHIDNLNAGKILDVTQLEPVRIAMVHLP